MYTTILNNKTQKANNLINKYFRALYNGCEYVADFYCKPSRRKIDAEREILKKMEECGGVGYTVTGGNTCTFAAGWLLKDGEKYFLIYETNTSTYKIEISQNAREYQEARAWFVEY